MARQDGLIRTFSTIITLLLIGNFVCLAIFVLGLAATFAWQAPLLAHLRAASGSTGETELIYMRMLMIAGMLLVYVVERLFRALAAVVATLRTGDPFSLVNAERLKIVGWMLLLIQLSDVAFGLATFWAKARHIHVLDWTPSFTGWLGVLVAFVLARVFVQGAAMRDDLDGTV